MQGAAPHRDRLSSGSPSQPVASRSQHSCSEGFVVVLWWGAGWNEEPRAEQTVTSARREQLSQVSNFLLEEQTGPAGSPVGIIPLISPQEWAP